MKCSMAELKKFFRLVDEKKIRNKVAAKACGYTPEHFTRLRMKFKSEGDRIFVHGHCGKPAYNAISDEIRRFIVEQYLVQNDNETNPINFRYWTDELRENYNIDVSYRTVANIMERAGVRSPECRRSPRDPVRRQRFRRPNFGELVQWDATPYHWFSWAGDMRNYALHGALDDSRSAFLGLYMTEFECRYGYIECRRQVLTRFGIELEDYCDMSPVFYNSHGSSEDKLTTEEQLEGIKKKSPLWETMNRELGIKVNLAGSPQAKGKVERAWGTVQKRLVNELKKRNLTRLPEVNAFLREEFVDYYNNHFAKNTDNVSVFRPLPRNLNLRNVLCVKEQRTVQNDGCIRFMNLRLKVVGLKSVRVTGYVCIDETGVRFLYKGVNYPLNVKNSFETLSERAPQVLENIIYKYMYEEQHLPVEKTA